MDDFKGMTDREILIAVALRQEQLSKELIKFGDAQTACNMDIESRMRNVEIYGSKVSQDLAVTAVVSGKRLDKVEDFIQNHKGEEHKTGDTLRDIGLIAAVIAAFVAMLAEFRSYL
jgi:hypothetical protein